MTPVQYRPRGSTVKELAEHIESAIRSGELPPEAALPPIRSVAGDLGIAPGTVAGAYAALRDRGLLESRGRAGTFVRYRPVAGRRTDGAELPDGVVDLAGGQPDPRLLPQLRPGATRAAAPETGMLPDLADAARTRLTADGVPADHLTLSHGGLDGIGRVLQTRLRPGDVVAVEDPGWPNALALVAALGLRAVPVAVDDAGMTPDGVARALRGGAGAVIVTDRAQNPTGCSLDARRAAELRTVLGDHPETLVIEDDHAAELAGGRPHVLAGATDRWAFVRSASKPYGPDLRIAVLAGDAETVARVEDRMRAGSGWVSTILQRLLLGCWTSPEVAAEVARAADAYDARRSALVNGLNAAGIAAVGATGLNVWVPVPDEAAAVSGLLRAGWAVAPGTRFRLRSAPAVRITVSNLDLASVPTLITALATVLHPGRPSFTT